MAVARDFDVYTYAYGRSTIFGILCQIGLISESITGPMFEIFDGHWPAGNVWVTSWKDGWRTSWQNYGDYRANMERYYSGNMSGESWGCMGEYYYANTS